MKTIYQCSDTVTGVFSAVYDAWKAGCDERKMGIALKDEMDRRLFGEYVQVEEAERKAAVVQNTIEKHMGPDAALAIYQAALSADSLKGDAILGTIAEARRISDSRKIMNHLGNPSVEKVFELSRSVGIEAHLFLGFVRFRELENRVLFSEIEPKSQILTCIADHFAGRLPLENWMIYDRTHQMFLVHEAKKRWVLVSGEGIERIRKISSSEAEAEFTRLWCGFCQSISIAERTSRKRQMQHLPLHFRQDMVEFQ